MKITIYELLGLIKDGKAPKKFIYDNQLFILDEEDNVYRSHLGNRFGAMYQLDIKLNDEIELLEGTLEEQKKIPEKLGYCEENTFINKKGTTFLSSEERRLLDSNFKELGNKINSIIDYLKSKGE